MIKKQEQKKSKKTTTKPKKTGAKKISKKVSSKPKIKDTSVGVYDGYYHPEEKESNPLVDVLIPLGACLIGFFLFIVVFGPGPQQIRGVQPVSNPNVSRIEVEFYDLAKSTFRGTELEKLGWKLTKEDERNVALVKGDKKVIVGIDSYVAGLQQYRMNIPQRDIEEILDFQAHLLYFTREEE